MGNLCSEAIAELEGRSRVDVLSLELWGSCTDSLNPGIVSLVGTTTAVAYEGVPVIIRPLSTAFCEIDRRS